MKANRLLAQEGGRRTRGGQAKLVWTWWVNGKGRSEMGFLGIEGVGVQTGKGFHSPKNRKRDQSCDPRSA